MISIVETFPILAACPDITLTAIEGSFSSPASSKGDVHYDTDLRCRWLIRPDGAQQIRLFFTEFGTEEKGDVVRIYDGADTTATLLAEFSGSNVDLSESVVSSGGVLLVVFITNNLRNVDTDFGWKARYVSSSVKSRLTALPEKLDFGAVIFGKTSPNAQSFTITGKNLTDDVTIAAPRGYSISTSQSGGFTDTLTLPGKRDTLSQQIFVQFTPTSVGDFDKRIAIVSRTAFAAVSVEGVAPPAIYWEPLTGPFTASILSMDADDEDMVYAGTHNGLYRSNTNGHAWLPSNDGLRTSAAQTIRSVVVFGNEVFIGTDDGVYKSDNQGRLWTKRSTGLPQTVHTLVGKGDTLLAGTPDGVFRTTDDGQTWKPLNNGLAKHTDITAMFISEAVTFIATGDSLLYRSTNHGETWTLDNTFGKYRVNCFTEHDGIVFAGTQGGWIYGLQADKVVALSAAKWVQFPLQKAEDGWQYVQSLAVDKEGVLYAGTEDGVFRSADDGSTWELRDKGLTEPVVTALAIEGENVYAGTDAGIFITENKAASWREANTGLTGAIITDMTEHRGVLLAGTAGDGVFRSTDNGASWTEADAGLLARYVGGFVSKGRDVFVTAFDEYDPSNARISVPGVYRSADNGLSWTAVLIDTVRDAGGKIKTLHPLRTVCISDAGTIVVGGDEGVIWRSTTDGATWTRSAVTTSALLGQKEVPPVTAIAVGLNSALFASTLGEGVYRSDDDGRSWTRIFGNERNGLDTLPTLARRVNHVLRERTALFAATDAGLYRSLSNGLTWARMNFPDSASALKETIMPQSLLSVGGALYAGTDAHGVWRSLDDGLSWQKVNAGLAEDADVTSFAATGATDLYIGLHGNVIFRSSLQSSDNAARAFIEIPDTLSAKPGEDVIIPIILRSIQSPPPNVQTIRVRTVLRFNAALLDPGPDLRQEAVVNGERLIPLTFELRPNAGAVLKTLTFKARLGDAVATPLILGNPSADGIIVLTPKPGIFTLKGLSHEGGVRLFISERAPLLAAAPNPASSVTTVKYELFSSSSVNISLVNVYGQTVTTFVNKTALPGEYTLPVSMEELPPGAYFLVLRTPTHVATQPVHIVR